MMAQLWKDALRGQPVHLVANADDPMVVWAARGSAQVTWVAAGQRWHDDSWVCPECGGAIERTAAADSAPETSPGATAVAPPGALASQPLGTATALATPPADASAGLPALSSAGGAPDDDWRCTNCDLRRPVPSWRLDGTAVIDPAGGRHEVTLQLPGRVNRANAATALAVAAQLGVRPADALPRLAEVASIAGRYAQVERDGRAIRLLLAKNPAGWLEAFDMADPAPTLLSINSRDPDGLDTSWLFDVDFSPLAGRPVLITGDRAYDLAVRLEVNEVPFAHVTSFAAALAATPPGKLEVIANYTAFQDIRAELDRVN
jgi:rubredoxin